MTGEHWPGNADGHEEEPDMRDMDEEERRAGRLPGGEMEMVEALALRAYGCDGDADDLELDAIWDLINGERECLAACSTRNVFKISVSNRSPSWRNTITWQT